MNNVMLDLETLGNSSGCIILSIGAVHFDPKSNEIDPFYFYSTISPEDSQKHGLKFDASTVIWWMQQNDAARKALTSATAPPVNVLDQFAAWLPKDAIVWGNGSDFDNVILAEAYKVTGKPLPWKFWNNRCFRTLKNLRRDVKAETTGTAHNALDDAINQAKHCQAIFKVMK